VQSSQLFSLPFLLAVSLPLAGCQSPSTFAEGLSPSGYALAPSAVTLLVGDSLTVRLIDPKADTLPPTSAAWSTNDSLVVTIDQQGHLLAHGSGQAVVTATLPAGALSAGVIVRTPARPAAIQFGLHMNLTFEPDRLRRSQVARADRALGAVVSRGTFDWSRVERTQGARDWAEMDSIVAEFQGFGLEPLMVVMGSPAWANGVAPSTADAELYVPQDSAAFTTWTAQYAAFMTEAASRYSGRIRKWELWNEENDIYFWKPVPNLDRYVQWYGAVAAAIKKVDPTAQVSIGGLSGLCCTGPTGINGFAFLEGLYSRGVSLDIVAIHPYPDGQQGPEVTLPHRNNFTDIERVHSIMVAHGAGDRPLWITEWGWSTAAVSEATQATYVERSLQMIYDQYTYVTLATYFLDYDRAGYPYGLADSSLRPKPAGLRFRDFVSSH